MQSLTIKSYAKLNIGLKVLDTLPDGYHAIFTIMHGTKCPPLRGIFFEL